MKNEIAEVLKNYSDPVLRSNYLELRSAKYFEDQNTLEISLDYPAKRFVRRISDELSKLFIDHGLKVRLDVRQKIRPHAVRREVRRAQNVSNLIAVASGKGGVGKSTVSVNLAVALSVLGAKVGILDADIYGPSLHVMFGLEGVPVENDGKKYFPVRRYGMDVNSVGLFIDKGDPVIWRGPLAAKTLTQLFSLTAWENLDYLIVDLPPGTGDIQITLSESVPVTAGIIVTTPQDVAAEDADRAFSLFEKIGIPVLGVVENMAYYTCPCCGHVEYIFGQGGAEKIAARHASSVLASLELVPQVRKDADGGQPTVAVRPDDAVSQRFIRLALDTARKIAYLPIDHSAQIPMVKKI